MVSMKMAEKEEEQETALADKPMYPYGLSMTLSEEVLSALKIKTMPEVGTELVLTAVVEVCSQSQYQATDGECERSMSIQITAMDLSKPTSNYAGKLYGDNGDQA